MNPPFPASLTRLATSTEAPPNVLSHSLLPSPSTRTTQKSSPPQFGLLLLPLVDEVEPPPKIKPPSEICCALYSWSAPSPPKVRCQSSSPFASRRMIQKSEPP